MRHEGEEQREHANVFPLEIKSGFPAAPTFPVIVNTSEVLSGPFGAGGVKLPFGLVRLRLEVKL